jgi:hypothetical protein
MVAVYRRHNGVCCCGCRRVIRHPRPINFHHVLARQRWPELADDARNVVLACEDSHANHEAGYCRFPRRAVAVVEELPLDARQESYLERTYGPKTDVLAAERGAPTASSTNPPEGDPHAT